MTKAIRAINPEWLVDQYKHIILFNSFYFSTAYSYMYYYSINIIRCTVLTNMYINLTNELIYTVYKHERYICTVRTGKIYLLYIIYIIMVYVNILV